MHATGPMGGGGCYRLEWVKESLNHTKENSFLTLLCLNAESSSLSLSGRIFELNLPS
jgi:hypothetical protein